MTVYYAILVAGLIGLALGHPTGAPDSSCDSMTPGHGVPALTSLSPYTVSLSNTSIKTGETVRITIKANPGEYFKGFLIQGRTGTQPVGTFLSSDKLSFLNCANGENNAVTQKDAELKHEVVAEWLATPDLKGKSVNFYVTIVKKYDEFWVGQKSDELTIV